MLQKRQNSLFVKHEILYSYKEYPPFIDFQDIGGYILEKLTKEVLFPSHYTEIANGDISTSCQYC